MADLPKHSQLVLPLLQILEEHNGLRAKDAAAAVAERLALDDATQAAKTTLASGRVLNAYERRVRWVRQTLVGEGLISAERHNWWELTDKARSFLTNCRPGVVITVFETDSGAALWAEAESAVAYVKDGSIDLIITSPEYPLVKPKAYGNKTGAEYLDWLTSLAAAWKPKLRGGGSLVLNLQDVYEPGQPTLSLYQEELLLRLVRELNFHLCQKFVWHNPTKPPATEWATVRRVRVKSGYEMFYWLAPTPHPKADNRNVLRPYSDTMRRILATGGDQRPTGPSGHGHLTPGFQRDNGGSIPDNVLVAHNASSSDSYLRGCRAEGLPIHPARFPDEPLAFFIKFLSEELGTVWDPLAGSLKVGEVAERLGRRWIANEKSLSYLYGGRHRFANGNWIGPNPLELQRAMAGC